MTENDLTPRTTAGSATDTATRRERWSVIGLIGGIATLVFVVAAGAGFVARSTEGRSDGAAASWVVGAALVAIALGAAWVTARSLKQLRNPDSGMSRRDRRNTLFAGAFLLIGAGLGALVRVAELGGGQSDAALTGVGPLDPTMALLFALVLLFVLPLAYLYYHRRLTDELEEAAYRQGALLALYAYSIGAPAWWVLWRGGWLREPDGPIIFVATMTVWVVGYAWAKYR